jgi:hypothetical protein
VGTIHPHMLRHGCGYALANAGHATRRLQAYPGTRIYSTRCAVPSWRRIDSRISGDSAPRDPTRFRTIQVCPKDLPTPLRQVERAVNRGPGWSATLISRWRSPHARHEAA